MSTLITAGSASITPTILLMVSEDADGAAVVHNIIGRENPDITLRAASRRTGTVELGFSGAGSESASAAAMTVLRSAALFTMSDTDRPSYNMTFVVPEGGRISRRIETETRDAFTITVDYQECSA